MCEPSIVLCPPVWVPRTLRPSLTGICRDGRGRAMDFPKIGLSPAGTRHPTFKQKLNTAHSRTCLLLLRGWLCKRETHILMPVGSSHSPGTERRPRGNPSLSRTLTVKFEMPPPLHFAFLFMHVVPSLENCICLGLATGASSKTMKFKEPSNPVSGDPWDKPHFYTRFLLKQQKEPSKPLVQSRPKCLTQWREPARRKSPSL